MNNHQIDSLVASDPLAVFKMNMARYVQLHL